MLVPFDSDGTAAIRAFSAGAVGSWFLSLHR